MNHKEYIIPIGEEAKDYDEMFIAVIRRQPELVRCKDCANFNGRGNYCYCGIMTHENGFCSWAERREE